MTNSYYNNDDPPAAGTRARSANESADRDAVEAAFDKLPTEAALKNGVVNFQMTDTGAADAYVITATYITALTAGQTVLFKAANANTGASTLNVSGLGVKAIKNLSGSALVSGDIVAGGLYLCGYDGTNWVLLNRDNAGTSATAAAASASAAASSQTSAATSAATATAYGGMVIPLLLQ